MIVLKKRDIQLHYLGVFILLLCVLVIMIIGAASPWYHLPLQSNSVLQEYITYMKYEGNQCTYSEGDCPPLGEQIRLMFGLILSGVVASHLLICVQLVVLAFYAFPRYSTLRWRERLWLPLLTITTVTTLCTTGTWTLLYLHPTSLAADSQASCTNQQPYFCEFKGTEFGPSAGWFLFMVANIVMYAVMLVLPFFGAPQLPPGMYQTTLQ